MEKEYQERTLDRGFIDVIGLSSPTRRMDDGDPVQAMDALATIRRLSCFLKTASCHTDCQGWEWSDDDIRVMGDLADVIYVGAGYVLEFLEKHVRPQWLAAESEDQGKKKRPARPLSAADDHSL